MNTKSSARCCLEVETCAGSCGRQVLRRCTIDAGLPSRDCSFYNQVECNQYPTLTAPSCVDYLNLSCRRQTCDSRLVYIAGLHRLTETAGPRLIEIDITYKQLFVPTCSLTDLPGFVSCILCPALSLSWQDRKHT